MKIALVVIGKTDAGYFVEAINEYKNRLVHYIPFEMEVIPDIKNVKNLSESQQKEKEGELILKALQAGDQLVLLDDKGKEFTSMQFSAYIERKMHTVSKRLVFVVGGPYGFSEAVCFRKDLIKQNDLLASDDPFNLCRTGLPGNDNLE